MTTTDSEAFDPAMRAVLDWLVRHEARPYDFSEVAEGAGLKRELVEGAIIRLRHQRAGKALTDRAPDGSPLLPRSAYLLADSPHRASHKGVVVAVPLPVNPLEAHAQRRREKKARRDAYRQAEAAQLAQARAVEKRSEKEARKAAQEAVRERLLSPKPEQPAAATLPPPSKKPAVTAKEAPRG